MRDLASARGDGVVHRYIRSVVLLAAAIAIATPACADDKSVCADGIAATKAEFAQRAPDAVPPKAKRALKIAEREQGEGEFDECVEALDDVKRAMK